MKKYERKLQQFRYYYSAMNKFIRSTFAKNMFSAKVTVNSLKYYPKLRRRDS